MLLASLFALTTIPTTIVQATPKPSIPQFTIKLVDNSYDVPPSTTTTVDSYTGKETTTTKPGYRVDNRSIEVTIKNQPFTPYTNADGYECKLYYNVQAKGHFGNDTEWRTQFFSYGPGPYSGDSRGGGIAQSNSGHTVASASINYPVGSLVDFKAEAFIGYWVGPTIVEHLYGFHGSTLTHDVSSGWSGIQTITIPSGTVLSSPPSQTTILPLPSTTFEGNQTQTSPLDFIFAHQSLFLLVVGFLFVGVIVAVVRVFLRRHLKNFEFSSDSP